VADQLLEVFGANGALLRSYPVSTSRFGLGTEPGSLKTPLGRLRVSEKFGAGEDLGAVFRGRVPTGENGLGDSSADLVLTRILWLEGLDPENANTKERYIYIHGTNHEETIGQPDSHGCVRMRNADVIELFDLVPAGAEVRILETL
jgi:lipoprotein-anchoring transpeptidase ErfK/SrfK